MNLLLDFVPLALFGLAYWLQGIYVATAVLIVSLFAAVGAGWLLTRKLNRMLLGSAVLAAALGGLTLALHDPSFIKLKPTLLYAAFALAFVGSEFIGQRVLLQRMMGHVLQLPPVVWLRLNRAWAVFFVGCAVLNYYVAGHYSEATWVRFKLIVFSVLPILFVIMQAPFLARYMEEPVSPAGESPEPAAKPSEVHHEPR